MSLARPTPQTPPHAVQPADRGGATARRAPAQHLHHARSALRFLPLLSLLLPIWACGTGPRVGARSLPVTHRPASQLRLAIEISGQYSDRPDILVLVRMFEGPNPNDEVSFAERAHLTCNGRDIKPTSQVYQLLGEPCPCQPPGRSYRITYTDEHGASTTVVVPIPAGSFAILSPRAGSTVPIPTDGLLEVRYALPIPPPDGSVAIDSVSASCGTSPNVCGAVYATLQNSATPTPSASGGLATAMRFADRGPSTPTPGGGAANATPVPGATPAPGATPTPPATPTPGEGNGSATATQSGGLGTILLRGDYTMFRPGPGSVELEVEARVTPDRGGFAAATATFSEEPVSAPITWVR